MSSDDADPPLAPLLDRGRRSGVQGGRRVAGCRHSGTSRTIVEGDPVAGGAVLDRWALDDDFWIRRSALLALLIPLRRGDGDFERFGRYADAMLDEREFFVAKAIGWVLRDTTRKRPGLVYEWFLPRAGRASTVTLREVLKPLSDDQRAAIKAAAGK